MPRSPQWTDMHLIWHSRRGRRRNHLWQLFQVFGDRLMGCRFCGGSKIAIFYWLSQWPLTQGYRAACDTLHNSITDNRTHLLFCFSGRTVDVKLDQSHLVLTGSREDVKKAQDFFHSSFLQKLGYDKLEICETGLDQSSSLKLCGIVA